MIGRNITMAETKDLDPEIKKIEEDIIHFIINSHLFFGRDAINLMIMGYFLTRRILTQKKLKDLTGLSAGKISRELNRLVELGFIKKKKTMKRSQLIYYVESAKLSIFPYISDFLNVIKKWDINFKKIKKEIEEDRKELEQNEHFNKILEVVDHYLGSLPDIMQILNDLENI